MWNIVWNRLNKMPTLLLLLPGRFGVYLRSAGQPSGCRMRRARSLAPVQRLLLRLLQTSKLDLGRSFQQPWRLHHLPGAYSIMNIYQTLLWVRRSCNSSGCVKGTRLRVFLFFIVFFFFLLLLVIYHFFFLFLPFYGHRFIGCYCFYKTLNGSSGACFGYSEIVCSSYIILTV